MEEMTRMLGLGGGWGNVSGPGTAMIRAMTASILSSVFMGMTGASVGSIIWDTAALPFLIAACGGFMLGAIGFYRDALRKSLRALDRYPRIMQLHLDANHPHRGFDAWGSSQLQSKIFANDWKLQSMLIVSWMTASPVIDRIKESREDALVLQHAEEKEIEE